MKSKLVADESRIAEVQRIVKGVHILTGTDFGGRHFFEVKDGKKEMIRLTGFDKPSRMRDRIQKLFGTMHPVVTSEEVSTATNAPKVKKDVSSNLPPNIGITEAPKAKKKLKEQSSILASDFPFPKSSKSQELKADLKKLHDVAISTAASIGSKAMKVKSKAKDKKATTKKGKK